MNVVRSKAQPELVHAVFLDKEVDELLDALKKPKNETAAILRRALKKARCA